MTEQARTCPFCSLTVPTAQIVQHYLRFHRGELKQAITGLSTLNIEALDPVIRNLAGLIDSCSAVARVWPVPVNYRPGGAYLEFTARYIGDDRLSHTGPDKTHPGWQLRSLLATAELMAGVDPLSQRFTDSTWRVTVKPGLIEIQCVSNEDEQPQGRT